MSEEEIRTMCNDIYEGGHWDNMIDLIKNKDKEIERLNNIINELEKYINQKIEQCYNEGSTVGEFYKICDIEEKLQELKGSDKE